MRCRRNYVLNNAYIYWKAQGHSCIEIFIILDLWSRGRGSFLIKFIKFGEDMRFILLNKDFFKAFIYKISQCPKVLLK